MNATCFDLNKFTDIIIVSTKNIWIKFRLDHYTIEQYAFIELKKVEIMKSFSYFMFWSIFTFN